MTCEAAGAVTQDALLSGRVKLLQPRRGHRAGTDAVILAGLAQIRPGDHVIDLGSASGAVGLMIAARHLQARVTLIERDPNLVALARRNIALNGVDDRVAAAEADVFATSEDGRRTLDAAFGAADVIITNPPFFQPDNPPASASPDPGRRAARLMSGGDLDDWVSAARGCLALRGRLWLIHRADRLDACFSALRGAFGSLCVTPVYPKIGAPASRVVISAVAGGRAPARLTSPLVLHDKDGTFTLAAERLHRGQDER